MKNFKAFYILLKTNGKHTTQAQIAIENIIKTTEINVIDSYSFLAFYIYLSILASLLFFHPSPL